MYNIVLSWIAKQHRSFLMSINPDTLVDLILTIVIKIKVITIELPNQYLDKISYSLSAYL